MPLLRTDGSVSQDLTVSCMGAELTEGLEAALLGATLSDLTLIGVQQWWQKQPER